MAEGPSLLPGEELLHTQDKIRTFVSHCGGKSSSAAAIPFFTKWTLFITDRRVHLATTALSLFTIRKDFWFSNQDGRAGRHVLQSATGNGKLTLTIQAHNPLKPERPAKLIMKFGFKDAGNVARLVQEHIETANQQVERTG